MLRARRALAVTKACVGLALACALVACATDHDGHPHERPARPSRRATATPEPAAAGRALERPAFCDREGDDSIRDLFCTGELPTFRSLLDLQLALRLTPGPASEDAQSTGDDFYVRFPVLLGHSTALSGRL